MVFTNRTAKRPSEDSFVRGVGFQSLERTEVAVAVPLRAQECGTGLPVCLPGKLSFWVPIGGDGGHNTAYQEPVRLQRPKSMIVRARGTILWWKKPQNN